MSRNVVYIKPAPQAGILIWTFVGLYYVGIILPLMMVWYFIKFSVIGTLWIATQVGVFLAARKANTPPPAKRGRHRERPHPLERLVLGKELSEELRERERVSA